MAVQNKKRSGMGITLLLAGLWIVIGLVMSAVVTILVLAITDAVVNPRNPQTSVSGRAHRSGMLQRVNWLYAAAVFGGLFLFSQFLFYRKPSRKLRGKGFSGLSIKTTDVPKSNKPAAPDPDEHQVSFNIRRINNRYGDLLIGFAKVRFKVPGCDQEFTIEQRPRASDLDLLSVVPVLAGNSTAQLIGKYDSTSSDREFFNAFMADDEVIGDLLTNYNGRQKTTITFGEGEFHIECEEEDIFENGTGVGHEETLLNILQNRARVYSRRFSKMGLLRDGAASITTTPVLKNKEVPSDSPTR